MSEMNWRLVINKLFEEAQRCFDKDFNGLHAELRHCRITANRVLHGIGVALAEGLYGESNQGTKYNSAEAEGATSLQSRDRSVGVDKKEERIPPAS